MSGPVDFLEYLITLAFLAFPFLVLAVVVGVELTASLI